MKQYLFFVLILFSILSFSQDSEGFKKLNDIKSIEEKLNKHALELNTIQSQFVQEKHLAFLNDVIVSDGNFWFKKENNLRWEYVKPFEYAIVLNKGKFIIKDGEDINEFDINSNKAFQEVNNLIISSVRGTLLSDDKFEASAQENNQTYLIQLTPKDEEMLKVLKRIELYFSKVDLNIFKVKMFENDEDYTIITFENKKINEEIPASIFIVN